MKIAVHITFFLDKNIKKKLKELSFYYNNFFKLSKKTEVFVHTNKKIKNFKKNLNFIFHDITNEDPYKLTWKCRSLMEEQKNKFDYFIYCEDDTIFTKQNFNYWLKYKGLYKKNYNIGFLRTEVSPKTKELWSTDQFGPLNKYVLINKAKFIVLDTNPYYAMWIYDKNEFKLFVKSKFWNLNNWSGLNPFATNVKILGTREKSAVGWHALNMDKYKATIIPLKNNFVRKECLIIHRSNKYISKEGTIHVSIKNLISKKLFVYNKKKYSSVRTFLSVLMYYLYLKVKFNFKDLKKIIKKIF